MTEIRHVVCTVPCSHCSNGWVHGPKYEAYGEMLRCPVCNSSQVTQVRVPFSEFAAALRTEFAKTETPCGCNDECMMRER